MTGYQERLSPHRNVLIKLLMRDGGAHGLLSGHENRETSPYQRHDIAVVRDTSEVGMKWKEEYATGIQRIDEQHKMIFKMAEDFRSALDAGFGESAYGILLEFLSTYCTRHFNFEGQCMEKYRCPVAEKNREEHSMFLVTLQEYTRRYVTNGYLAADARELVDTVDRWLDEHICRIDVHLRKCIQKQE